MKNTEKFRKNSDNLANPQKSDNIRLIYLIITKLWQILIGKICDFDI